MHDHDHAARAHAHHHEAAASESDPICGMTVDPETAQRRHAHDGRTYVFCSAHCLHKFRDHPVAYVGDAGNSQAATGKPASADDAVYTCPMHPEIEQIGLGTCLKCGMALEPKQISAVEGPSTEYIDMRRRFWISAVLALPLVVVAMGRHIAPSTFDFVSAGWLNWFELAAATPIVLWAAWPFFKRFAASIRTLHPNMWTLIGLGVGAAWLFSVVATLMAQHKQTPTSEMLAEVPGIGPLGVLGLVQRVDFSRFMSGRHFASWLGLTPRERSTGGKMWLGGISRAGGERSRWPTRWHA